MIEITVDLVEVPAEELWGILFTGFETKQDAADFAAAVMDNSDETIH